MREPGVGGGGRPLSRDTPRCIPSGAGLRSLAWDIGRALAWSPIRLTVLFPRRGSACGGNPRPHAH